MVSSSLQSSGEGADRGSLGGAAASVCMCVCACELAYAAEKEEASRS